MEEGTSSQLTATVLPADATDKSVTWTSSDESIATVDASGLVTAIAAGEVKITATTVDGGYADSVMLTVTPAPVAVASVAIDSGVSELEEGTTDQLTATVLPADATDKNVTWASSDESVATVDASGLVTAVAAGEVTITVITVDGGYKDTLELTVTAGEEDESTGGSGGSGSGGSSGGGSTGGATPPPAPQDPAPSTPSVEESTEKLQNHETLSADQAVEEASKLMEGLSVTSDDENLSKETVDKAIETVSSLLDREDISADQAVEITSMIIEKSIMSTSVSETPAESNEVKAMVNQLVGKTLEKASQLSVQKNEAGSVIVDSSSVDEAIQTIKETTKKLQETLQTMNMDSSMERVKPTLSLKVDEEDANIEIT
jgi:hypothetical protein